MPVFLDERTSLETWLPPSPANERNMKQSFGQDEVPKQRVWEPERNFGGNKSEIPRSEPIRTGPRKQIPNE